MSVLRVGRAFTRLVVFSLCFAIFTPLQVSAMGPLMIGEVAWAGSSLSTSDEWVEIWNMSDDPLSLRGYRLDGAGGEEGILFREQDSIPAHGTFLIANFSSTDTRSSLTVVPDMVTSTLSLSNEKLQLALLNTTGQSIDLAGDGKTPFAGTSTQNKVSMTRLSGTHAGDVLSSWKSSTEAVHLKNDVTDLGTPGKCDGCFQTTSSPSSPEEILPVSSSEAIPVPDIHPETIKPVEVPIPLVTAPTPSDTEPIPPTNATPTSTVTSSSSTVVDTSEVAPVIVVTSSTVVATPITETPLQPISSSAVVSSTVPVSVTVVSSTTDATPTSTHQTTLDIHVPQQSVSATSAPLHISLTLTFNHALSVNLPAQDRTAEYVMLRELLESLLEQKTFQMAMIAPETMQGMNVTATNTIKKASTEASSLKKTLSTPSVAKPKVLTSKNVTTPKKSVKKALVKSVSASKPAPMPTTINAAADLASEAPRVVLTGTVVSPTQLLGRNQFVIQAPDGRGLLVQGNAKQPTPSLHQTIRVEGTLVLNDSGMSLRMYATDRWTPAPTEGRRAVRVVDLLAPSAEDEWSLIEVTGTVAAVNKQSLTLHLGETAIRIRIPTVLGYRTERVKKGDTLRVRGLLALTKDEHEVYPPQASDITILDHASTTIAQGSSQPHTFPHWAPIGAAGASIAVTQGVRRLHKMREERRLKNMLVDAQAQLISENAPSRLV